MQHGGLLTLIPPPFMLTAVLAAMVASSAPRTFLVTGSTDGIGRFTATQLAKAGHTVLVHGRSAEKVARVVTEVRACGAASVDGFVADLSLCSEVRRGPRAPSGARWAAQQRWDIRR